MMYSTKVIYISDIPRELDICIQVYLKASDTLVIQGTWYLYTNIPNTSKYLSYIS